MRRATPIGVGDLLPQKLRWTTAIGGFGKPYHIRFSELLESGTAGSDAVERKGVLMLYAKLVNGRVDQESALDSSHDTLELLVRERPGYVPVLAVRAEGVEKVKTRIALCTFEERWYRNGLREALRVLGLEEKP